MATHSITDLKKLDEEETVIRLAYGKADESLGQKKHFVKVGGSKKNPSYSLQLAMFELRPCDDDHLSIHRECITGWEKCINTMYAELTVQSIHSINESFTPVDILSEIEDISSLPETTYSCLATDYGSSDDDRSHGGIFFYNVETSQTITYDEIQNRQDDYDDLDDYPFTRLSQQLLKAVTGFYNSKGEQKDYHTYLASPPPSSAHSSGTASTT